MNDKHKIYALDRLGDDLSEVQNEVIQILKNLGYECQTCITNHKFSEYMDVAQVCEIKMTSKFCKICFYIFQDYEMLEDITFYVNIFDCDATISRKLGYEKGRKCFDDSFQDVLNELKYINKFGE